MSADVVVVRMTRQNDFDVLQFESERFDVRAHNRRRLFETGVEQDVPGRCRNQVTSQIVRADVMYCADDPKWFEWLIRFFTRQLLAQSRLRLPGKGGNRNSQCE